ncbi:DEKNAAC100763 [Brettanomyces naardenensis]|uniref:DEKNAAC100763 n=1 Tax=Brettanomyces naardenensis TaxID=13370 RepID=A0A448YG09_BRENA|nr:DEKNAAC100763 [Brettanomyces naardenensis]
MANNIFNVQIFFVILREALEAVVIIATLLAFVNQSLGAESREIRRKLDFQIWAGAAAGIVVCLAIGGGFIGAYYTLKKDYWAKSEDLWEGIFCIIANVLITVMGISMLRINKMQAKWRVKIARALAKPPNKKMDRLKCSYILKKYSMFILPFITTLREGMEAVVFVGGVGIGASAKSIPLPVVCGLIAGILVGVLMYYGGSRVSLQVFLCISTAILYLIAAGLLSRGAWFIENHAYNQKTGGDASENGSGPGTYDIRDSVWHVNCCNPQTDNGWDIFNALLGWQNSATYGSILSYNLYWLAIIISLIVMLYEEKHGHLPLCKNLTLKQFNPMYYIKGSKKKELSEEEQQSLFKTAKKRLQEEAELSRATI